MGAKIDYTYPHRLDDTTIVQLPVYIDDVDELGVWLHVEPDPQTRWGGCIMWSQMLAGNLASMIDFIKKQEAGELNNQPEETT